MTRVPVVRSRPARGQAGFSTVELAVAVVILGIAGVLLARWVGMASSVQAQTAGRDLVTRADDAVLAYVTVHGRLPCPAVSPANGREDCSLSVGAFPFETVGLPDQRAGRIRYGVLRRASAGMPGDDADLASMVDRPRPLQVVGDSAAGLPLGTLNLLDFCHGLRTAMRLPADAAYVHTEREDQPGVIAQNIAYGLAVPAAPGGLSAPHRGASLAFAAPRRPTDEEYHDQVRAIGTDQLWSRLRCGDNLGPVEYAHFNAAAAAAVQLKALRDYKRQLEISKILADANALSAGAAVSAGAGQIATAAAGTLDAAAESLASTGALSYRVGLAAAGVVAAAAVEIAAAAFLAEAIIAADQAKELYNDIDAPIEDAEALAESVKANAIAADSIDVYVSD